MVDAKNSFSVAKRQPIAYARKCTRDEEKIMQTKWRQHLVVGSFVFCCIFWVRRKRYEFHVRLNFMHAQLHWCRPTATQKWSKINIFAFLFERRIQNENHFRKIIQITFAVAREERNNFFVGLDSAQQRFCRRKKGKMLQLNFLFGQIENFAFKCAAFCVSEYRLQRIKFCIQNGQENEFVSIEWKVDFIESIPINCVTEEKKF